MDSHYVTENCILIQFFHRLLRHGWRPIKLTQSQPNEIFRTLKYELKWKTYEVRTAQKLTEEHKQFRILKFPLLHSSMYQSQFHMSQTLSVINFSNSKFVLKHSVETFKMETSWWKHLIFRMYEVAFMSVKITSQEGPKSAPCSRDKSKIFFFICNKYVVPKKVFKISNSR